MRKLRVSHKNLMVLEAGFIWCKRRGIEFNEDRFFNEVFMAEDFPLEEADEYDNLCKDLRHYRRTENYKLIELTEEEYELCIKEFGGE